MSTAAVPAENEWPRYLSAAMAVLMTLFLFGALFNVKPFQLSSVANTPTRAYLLTGSAENILLGSTGPGVYTLPDAPGGFSSMRGSLRPLTPATLPALNAGGGPLKLPELESFTAPERSRPNALLDWLLTLPSETQRDLTAARYPKFIFDDANLENLELIPHTDASVRLLVKRNSPKRPTVLSYRGSPVASGLPQVKLETSCGVPALDRRALSALLGYLIAAKTSGAGRVTAVWAETERLP